MAKNIEMNALNDSGNYEVVYPKTRQELVIDLLNDDTKILLGLSADATADDAFRKAYLNGGILSEKSMVELTLLDSSTNKPIRGVIVTCNNFCDSSGTPMTQYISDDNGKILCFVNAVTPTLSISGYSDIANSTLQLSDVTALGTQHEIIWNLTTYDFKKYTSTSTAKFSGNVYQVDTTVVGGGGGAGGAGGEGNGTDEGATGGGGGGGQVVVTEKVTYSINTSYTATIGSGGNYGASSENSSGTAGTAGGTSSFLGVSATGGGGGGGATVGRVSASQGIKGGTAGVGVGGGNGGAGVFSGGVSGSGIQIVNGKAGSSGKVGYSSFTETVLYGAGGGSGSTGESDSGIGGAGGTYGGGKGGNCTYNRSQLNGTAGTAGSGSGGGSAGYYVHYSGDQWTIGTSAKGGSGCVAIRMHLKSRQ